MRKVRDDEKKQKIKTFINVLLVVFALCLAIFAVAGAFIIDEYSPLQQVEELSVMEEEDYKGEIDDRLRFIAMQEDEMGVSPDEQNNEENLSDSNETPNEPEEIAAFLQNEDVKKNKFEEYNEKYRKKPVEENNTEIDDIPYNKDVAISPDDVTLKVVIGDYGSKEAAQNELEAIKSQFSSVPFIKFVNGRYSLQVGSFKTRATADAFVLSLKQQGYSARIIEE